MIRTALKIVATTVVAAFAAVITLGVLGTMVFSGGRQEVQAAVTGAEIMAQFDGYVAGAVADSLEGMEPVRWIYELNDADFAAPEPNPACYGTAEDPSTLQWLLEEAEERLGVQTVVFSTETEIKPGSTVTYYLDDSIFVVSWKQVENRCVYTMSEVKIAHASQFRRYLSDSTYGSKERFNPNEISEMVNAVTLSGGDNYVFRAWGVNTYMGQVYNVSHRVDTCYITDSGDLLFTRAGELETVEAAQQFVDENHVRFSLAFGPVLVENGENVVPDGYQLGEINGYYSRAALCQLGSLHYLLAVANTEGRYKSVPTSSKFADQLIAFGVEKAFSLDGGQTGAIVTNNIQLNRPDYGYPREIADAIYFATAIPEERWNEE